MRKVLLAAACFVLIATQADAQTAIPTTNASITITTGNSFQNLFATIGRGRHSLTIQNNNASDSCWIFIGSGTASKATSVLLLAGQSYTRYYPFIPSDVIQATCATSSDTLYADTQ
jgi:hypothetical protein